MKILAGCIVRATEFFFHSGYLSAYVHTEPRYNLAPTASSYGLNPEPPPEPPPTGAAEVSFGNGADVAVGEEMTHAFGATSDAVVAPAATQGFYLDMYSGADRWTTLLIGIALFFVAAAFIAVMRGRRVTIDDTEPIEGVEILETQPSTSG